MASHERYDRRYARTLRDCTMEQLMTKLHEIENDPKNRNTVPGSIWRFTPAALGKLNAIAFAVTALLEEKRRKERTKEA